MRDHRDDVARARPPAPLQRVYLKYQFRRGGKKKTRWISKPLQACLDEECALVQPIDGPRAGGLCWHGKSVKL